VELRRLPLRAWWFWSCASHETRSLAGYELAALFAD
jgi:hypothetical protein